jgi:uncharacterized membrane protein YphA (DoxX/SURF4 family)
MSVARVVSPIILGCTFLLSGGLKSLDAQGPIVAAAAYDILPGWGALILGSLLPALEVVLGVALLSGWHRRAASAWAMLLGALFAVANSWALARGLVVDCQCFGGLGSLSLTVSLWIDAGIIFMGWLGFRSLASRP